MKIDLQGWQAELYKKDGDCEALCFSVDRDGTVTRHISQEEWEEFVHHMMQTISKLSLEDYSKNMGMHTT